MYKLNPKKAFSLLFFSVFSCFYTAAQKPEQSLEQWSQRSPIEKIYLHFDRESYIAGETAWFKAYLSSDHLPGTLSSTLYVELVSSDLSIVDKKILPVVVATSNGQFELPGTLAPGMYTVRAFTSSMMNQSPDFIFKKGIYIYGKEKKTTTENISSGVRMDFFPESGNLVTGFTNSIAFKATYGNGLPAPANGVIKNSKGEQVASFNEYHDGMGMFELTPVAGEKYMAVLQGAGAEQFPLPAPVEKGIVLTVIPHPQGSFFEIQQKTADPEFAAAYIIGQMQHHVVFRQELNAARESVQGVIQTQHLRSGILQITVFNKNGMPLAERLCFINNLEYVQPATLQMDTVDLSARGRNKFRIVMPDTVQGSISVSVTDAAYDITEAAEENIISSLLLTSDIKGYVHRPWYYFSSVNDSVKTATDLLMMTNGWRRFKWTELVKQQPPVFSSPAYITFSGRATLKGTNRSFSDKTVLLMISSMDMQKKRSTHILSTDKDGNFLIDSLVFFDKNRLLFSDVRGKKSQYIDIKLKGDSLNKQFSWSGFSAMPGKISAGIGTAKWQMDYDAILKESGVMLEGITLKVQKKSPAQQVDDRYTTGMFSGDAVKAIDLVNTDEALTYANIFDYLQSRVNGLQITADGADYGVYYRQGASMSSMGNIPMTIFLDEIETDVSVIATIPASQVALVKVYSSFAAAAGNAPGGVMAIYTKKKEDLSGGGIFANMAFYQGYSVIKEFYQPDHKVQKADNKTDNRITLEWRPNIFVNNINPRVPVGFYNNDRTKQFRIRVEGMTASGKLIFLEKIITGK